MVYSQETEIVEKFRRSALLSCVNGVEYSEINQYVLEKMLNSLWIHLSHKLQCYTGISGPEHSRNNTREKYIVFFHVC